MHKFARFVESLRAVMSHERSITRTRDGFVFSDVGRRQEFRLSDVIAVEGRTLNKITHEEDYLVLIRNTGEPLAVGELTKGFREFEQEVFASFAGFPRNWQVTVYEARRGERLCLWAAAR